MQSALATVTLAYWASMLTDGALRLLNSILTSLAIGAWIEGDSATPAFTVTLVVGLLAFGVVFAINSSLHSYLILAFAGADRLSMDVGFYYPANALGRLFGTLPSGLSHQYGGLSACLSIAALMALGSRICAGRPGAAGVDEADVCATGRKDGSSLGGDAPVIIERPT